MSSSNYHQYKSSYHRQTKETLIQIGEIGNWSYEVSHNSRTNLVLGYAHKADGMFWIFDKTAETDEQADELINEACKVVESKMLDDFRFRLMFSRKKL